MVVSLRNSRHHHSRVPDILKAMASTVWLMFIGSCTDASSVIIDPPGIGATVQRSDLIVVARVLGLADKKPEAQTRRQLEVHMIRVEQTLKGNDTTGQQLAVRPDTLSWQDDRSYIFFLSPQLSEGMMINAVVPQPVLAASQASIDEVADIVAAQGGAVDPRLILWITEDSGTGAEPRLTLAENGEFQRWQDRRDAPAAQREAVATTVIEALRSLISSTPVSIPPDDAVIIAFNWLDADLVVHTKVSGADESSTRVLLTRIEQLLNAN